MLRTNGISTVCDIELLLTPGEAGGSSSSDRSPWSFNKPPNQPTSDRNLWSFNQPTNQPCKQLTNQRTNQTVLDAHDPSANGQLNEQMNEPMNVQTNESTNTIKLTKQAVEHVICFKNSGKVWTECQCCWVLWWVRVPSSLWSKGWNLHKRQLSMAYLKVP